MIHSNAQDVRGHLNAEPDFQRRSVRFIENHDEPRAAEAFGREKSLAAAAVFATLPGMRFFHEGQIEGRKIKIPVQLNRAPEESEDPTVKKFYESLMKTTDQAVFHQGGWRLLDFESPESGDILTWCWEAQNQTAVVIVNYGTQTANVKVKFKKEIFLEIAPWESRFILMPSSQ